MGLSASKPDHEGGGADAYRRSDRGEASPRLRPGGFAGGLILFLSYLLVACAACADPLRVATWHGDFSRKGPGLMLADFDKVVPDLSPIMSTAPDVLVLTDIDYDAGLVTLSKLRDVLQETGLDYPHQLSVRPNTGMPTDLDIDGDGRRGGPRDAQGFGWFSGQGGMAVLSRFPVDLLADHSKILWKDTHDSTIAKDDPAFAIQRLSSSTFWAVRVETINNGEKAIKKKAKKKRRRIKKKKKKKKKN